MVVSLIPYTLIPGAETLEYMSLAPQVAQVAAVGHVHAVRGGEQEPRRDQRGGALDAVLGGGAHQAADRAPAVALTKLGARRVLGQGSTAGGQIILLGSVAHQVADCAPTTDLP